MASTNSLIKKREELKRRIKAGEYKTLVDVFLEWFDKLIRKITRQAEIVPLWLIIIVLSLIVSIIFFTAIYVAGDSITLHALKRLFDFEYSSIIFLTIMYLVLPIVFAASINYRISRICFLWHDEILDLTISVESLNWFEDWLKKISNRRLHLFVAIFGGVLCTYVYCIVYLENLLGLFVGYGYILGSIMEFILIASLGYQLLMVIVLSTQLSNYDLQLFVADPSNSEVIAKLSTELGTFVYNVAIYSAFFTLTAAQINSLSTLNAGLALLFIFCWLPLIALFLSNQTSISKIIRRTKQKTLSEIQIKVEKIQALKDFGNQKTMDSIKRLMDYHDRVKATRDSALDFRTYLNFINSLLLPLLAFILGNLDLIFNLFSKNP